jgi:hypothetical protein
VNEFFEPPPPPPKPPVHRLPVWAGPPDNELGVPVPLHVELARTDTLVLAVLGLVAFSTGFSFRLAIRRRVEPEEHEHPFMDLHHPHQTKPEALRFGIQFADGAKATTLGAPHWAPHRDAPPTGPVLSPHGGSGGGRSFEMSMWVWPLPPAGPLAFVCEWAAERIALTRREVDAGSILEAARQSEPLWPPDDGPDEGGSWTGYGRFSAG